MPPLRDPTLTVLGPDPHERKCILNGVAYQQDAITTFAGWQYAVFYSPLSPDRPEPLYIHLSRRQLPTGPWQTLAFGDYEQTTDDGHNTAQLGICPGDGTIHLSYDHHCDNIRFRHSCKDLALRPQDFEWSASHFTATLDHLPGLEAHRQLLSYITYPRFGPLGSDLWISFRTGKAGLGDDHLAVYRSSTSTYALLGKDGGPWLKGVENNPYIHGLDCRDGVLYATWVYRGFVWYEGWDDPRDEKHKAQAGPNDGSNNHDVCFAYSDDGGRVWRNGEGREVADLGKGESVTHQSEGVVVFEVPKGSGLSNQEAQAVDHNGGVHVLNRDSMGDDDGVVRWRHYYRDPDGSGKGSWTKRTIGLVGTVYGGKRGRLAISRDDDLYLILPDHNEAVLSILRASKESKYAEYELVWRGEGFPPTEPLVDIARLDHDNVMSIFTRAGVEGLDDQKNVVVLDFQL